MLKSIVDTQLPPRLASLLISFGYDAIHTSSFANGHLLSDSEINQIAVREDRIIVSKDSDFLDNYLVHGSPPRVLLLQFGNLSNNDLFALFTVNQHTLHELLNKGEGLVQFDRQSITAF